MTIILWHLEVCGIITEAKLNNVNDNVLDGKSFKNKTEIKGKTGARPNVEMKC